MTNKSKATGIKTWPEDDRPREKLLKKGARALSNSELLAILLRTGTKGTSALDLARKVLKKFGTFRNMAHTDSRDWKEFKGLGAAKIAHIQAALEIGRRFREDEQIAGKQKIKSAKDILSKTKWLLGIFPEGTRVRVKQVGKINTGFGYLAKATKTKILPVGIDFRRPHCPFFGKLVVRIGKLIEVSDNPEEVLDKWGQSISELTGFEYNKEYSTTESKPETESTSV